MKAYMLNRSGRPDVLRLTEVPEPVPESGEVKVRLAFAGLNYSEILSRKGLYGWVPKRPYVPGMEGAGEIIAVGSSVPESLIGEKVMVGAQYGCYAEFICVKADQALPVISDFTMQESAAVLVNFLTAWVALVRLGRLQPGETVLITAAAGGVGSAAIRIAGLLGAKVSGMAGSGEKVKFIESLGANGYDYTSRNIFTAVENDTGGLDVVLEMYGGDVYIQALRLLNPFGRMVVMGYASLDYHIWNPISIWRAWRGIPRVSVPDLSEHSTGVLSSHLGYLLKNPDLLRNIYGELRDFLVRHNIRPVIDRVFGFDELPAAHRYMEERRQKGKVLIRIKD
jgi:NADPH:quinone reductase-like Zn-dependent oxidoreductase